MWEAPDNVSMAATALAIRAGGALSSVQTTVLLTVDETLAALKKASSIKYRTPEGEGEGEGGGGGGRREGEGGGEEEGGGGGGEVGRGGRSEGA